MGYLLNLFRDSPYPAHLKAVPLSEVNIMFLFANNLKFLFQYSASIKKIAKQTTLISYKFTELYVFLGIGHYLANF